VSGRARTLEATDNDEKDVAGIEEISGNALGKKKGEGKGRGYYGRSQSDALPAILKHSPSR